MVDVEHSLYRVLKTSNFTKLYNDSRDHPATHVLNDIDFSDPDYAEQMSELVLSGASEVDFLSTCACGHLTGNFYDGEVCPICHEVVVNEMQQQSGRYPTRTWLAAPPELKHGWLSPVIYIMLEKWTAYNGKATKDRTKIQAYIRDLLDPTRPLPDFMKGWVEERVKITGTPRGFNFLYENFDRFIQSMLYEAPPNVVKKSITANLMKMLILYKDDLWCTHFPILFNSLHAIINDASSITNKRRYVDATVRHVFQSASDLSQLAQQTELGIISPKNYHSTVFKVYQNMMSYHCDIQDKQLSGKTSLPRKHIWGARHHLSSRSLISPISGQHTIDEIQPSWGCMVNMFRPHLMGRFMFEFNLTPRAAFAKHHEALQRYDPDVHMLLERFIVECPAPGIPVLVCRNPSVSYLSVQLMYIKNIKTDPSDTTMSISSRILSGFGGDFDGDDMNAQLLPEMGSLAAFHNLHGSVNSMDRNLLGVTKHFGIMNADAVTYNSWLEFA